MVVHVPEVFQCHVQERDPVEFEAQSSEVALRVVKYKVGQL